MGKPITSLLLVTTIVTGTSAFLGSNAQSSAITLRNRKFLSLSSSPDNNDSYGSDVFPKSRTDIRNFLTQRSIQSFAFLLNQCREEHTVRWLEKTLDFSSIDNFHGTGAFNLTKFPSWDSIFLDYIDRPEEVVVIELRNRRRQQKLSGHNAYFESLKRNSNVTRESVEDRTNLKSTNRAFSTARNYLDTMKPSNDPSPISKKSRASKTTSRKLPGSGNYLDKISSSSAHTSLSKTPAKPKKENSSKTTDKKKKSGLKEKGSNKPKKQTAHRGDSSEKAKKTSTDFESTTPSKSSNYLDSLSTIPIGEYPSNDNQKSKQSTDLSKNPFLHEKKKEYELSIDPPALVRRILSVREQLSKEWVEDLDVLLKLNEEITESFADHNRKATVKDDEDDDELNTKNPKDSTDEEKEDKNLSDLDALLKVFEAPTSGDSDSNASSTSSIEEKGQTMFDRTILNTWSQLLWNPKRGSSPYRKANFDLLLLLATQESIHRVLDSYKNDDAIRSETHEWLLEFYKDNVNEYFDGHQTHARSEDFLEEIFKSPRSIIETNNEVLAWVDPAIIAEDIVRERSEVTLKWMKIAGNISNDHTDLRRLLFTNMVSKTLPDESLCDTIVAAVKKEVEEDSKSSSKKTFGAFE